MLQNINNITNNDNNNDDGSNNLINDYKELFQKINISTNVIPQIRVMITCRLPKSYKVNKVVCTYPKIISSNNNNDGDNDNNKNDYKIKDKTNNNDGDNDDNKNDYKNKRKTY